MNIRFSLSIFNVFIMFQLFSQLKPAAVYSFGEDGSVVLNFHGQCLISQDEACIALKDFEDMRLSEVIKEKNKDQWQLDGWKLEKLTDVTYKLSKHINSFSNNFKWDDKYKIDLNFWKFPHSEALEETKYLKKPEAKVSPKGNQTFYLKGYKTARKVILSGSFNNWNEKEIMMIPSNDGWQITMDISPGIYEYKFIVDGEWMTDPKNVLSVINQHYTYNSILIIGQEVLFSIRGHLNAKSVILAGSFNNWNEEIVKMKKTKTGWEIKQKLPPGKHYYKFIIDNNWITDPDNNLQQKDEHGILNSVVVVKS